MSNSIRAFIVVLTLSGAASANILSTAVEVVKSTTTAAPRPVCNPGVPDGCGIGR